MGIWGFCVWGLGGSFIYAAPRVLVSLSDSARERKAWAPWAELLIALAMGPIGAAGFTGLVAATIHQTGVADLRAIALTIGMVANPVAPAIIHLVGDNILHRLNAPLKPIKPRKTS